MSERNLVPAAYEAIDMAGIGVKPATLSGPYCLTVYTCAAAMISVTSFQLERTKPPLPRRLLYARARSGSSTIDAHASTASPVTESASRHISTRAPRT